MDYIGSAVVILTIGIVLDILCNDGDATIAIINAIKGKKEK